MSIFDNLSHLSKNKGCGGRRLETPEGFIVEEIIDGFPVTELQENEVEGEYVIFLMKKRDITTHDAISKISKILNINEDRFGVAGQKDKNAITYQLVSIWTGKNISKKDILNLNGKIKGIEIIKLWNSDKKIKIGDLTGNKFTIKLEEVKDITAIERILNDTNYFIPNYFGPQRFGAKSNNIEVARNILLRNYKNAVYTLLADNKEEYEEMKKNERILDIKTKKTNFRYEDKIIEYINRHEGEEKYKNAIKIMPKSILKLIIESYQSYLFNIELSERIKTNELNALEDEKTCGFDKYGFINPEADGNVITCANLIGYDTKPNKIVEDILWDEGIEIGDFKLREFPYLACKGSVRPLLVNVKDLKIKENNIIEFKLPSGAYATSALREFCDLERE